MSNAVVSKGAKRARAALVPWGAAIGAFVVLGCLAPVSASAVDLKIAFISTERVLRESAPAIRSLKKLEREFEKRSVELKSMDTRFRALQNQLERDAPTMSEADGRAKERELASLQRDLQRARRSFEEDLNQRKNEEMTGLKERADAIIKQIAEQDKLDLILQEPVVWASPRIDITDRVIRLLADK